MDEKGQLMEVPIKLVMALVVGMLCMGVLVQFVGTAERSVIRDMEVRTSTGSGNRLTVKIYDAATGEDLNGATVVVRYPGGTKAHTLGANSNQYTFDLPNDLILVTLRVTREGYIPWESQIAL
jgi:hypothetical protein